MTVSNDVGYIGFQTTLSLGKGFRRYYYTAYSTLLVRGSDALLTGRVSDSINGEGS